MGLKKVSLLLKELDLEKRRRYISHEFQAYGLMLAKELGDWKNRSLYIKLAKQYPRDWLEKARIFIKDQTQKKIKSKPRLFMWKLAQIKNEKKKQVKKS